MKSTLVIFIALVSYVISEEECDKGENFGQCASCDGSKCASCNEKDFLKDGQCFNCFDHYRGCETCNETKCINCSYMHTEKDGKCVPNHSLIPSCLVIDKTNTSQCTDCLPSLSPSSDKTKCFKCPELCERCNSLMQCESCNTFHYLKDHKCYPCPENCNKCNEKGCFYCKKSFGFKDGKCIKGPDNCDLCIDYSKCKICNRGFGLIEGKCKECKLDHCVECSPSDSDNEECQGGYC